MRSHTLAHTHTHTRTHTQGSATTSTEVTGVVNGGLLATGEWAYDDGVLILTLSSDLIQNVGYTYDFTVKNRPTENAAQSITFENPSTFAASDSNKMVGTGGGVMRIEPLVISLAFAEQSAHWPCSSNTISVSLETSIQLVAGCKYGSDSSPAFSLSRPTPPKITLSGLTGTRLDADISTTASTDVPAPLNGITPTFTHADGLFVITPASDLAIGNHTFSFDVVNQETLHSSASLFLDTEWVTGSQTSVDVPTQVMLQPMHVIMPTTEATTTAFQSSNNPCAVNTITVSLITNVPLFLDCAPMITFSGLSGTSSDSASDITGLDLDYSGSKSISLASWSRTAGTLVLVPGETLPTGDTSDSLFTFVISFNVINPSKHQQMPGLNVEINYHGLETDPTEYLFLNEALSTVRAGVTGIAVAQAGDQNYPLQIYEAIATSHISQSSPWPCDDNTISVQVAIDIDLYPRCAPSIQLSNLVGSDTGSDTADEAVDITVTLYNDLNDQQTSVDRTAAWVKSSGTLTLSWFDATQLTASPIPKNQAFQLTFALQNPQTAQSSPSTSLSVFLDDDYHDASELSVASMVVPGGSQDNYTTSSWSTLTTCASQPGDADPLYIASVKFTEEFVSGDSLSSGSTNPCADSLITVQLRTNGPIFKSCVPALTLSGLSETATDDDLLALSGAAIVTEETFASPAAWLQSGSLKFDLKATILQGKIARVRMCVCPCLLPLACICFWCARACLRAVRSLTYKMGMLV